jgi:hypothetical protein
MVVVSLPFMSEKIQHFLFIQHPAKNGHPRQKLL